MSGTYIPAAMRRLVEERSGYRCKYCLLPAGVSFYPHEIDHIIAEKHGGATEASNLAFTCWCCNRTKGTDLGSFDPQTGSFSLLFNPRTQAWHEHFSLQHVTIAGLTIEGRTTANLLRMNDADRLAERKRIYGHVLYSDTPLAGNALSRDIVTTAQALPGYADWCQHQQEVEKRAQDWRQAIEQSHYSTTAPRNVQ